jgi:hypothetical protein
MIFAFLDGGTLEIHEDLASAQREHEGIHVEEGVVHFYNELGVYLEPKFIVPNRRGKLFGLIDWTSSGVFHLVPNAKAQQDSFALALHKTCLLAPNRWFDSLEQLKSELSAKGVVVAFQHSKNYEG